ncbi:hypothetical protein BANRA_03512 [Klebsiella pneumoniae]|uniref:Uncharacterized protein n=1 Tax=Klebsiella pneumoniae TaxID=573 RepID=A0ABD7UKD1_KLEPN|nr:hypothetical protein BANRA_03512 [Klebsiella pneumoniae]
MFNGQLLVKLLPLLNYLSMQVNLIMNMRF